METLEDLRKHMQVPVYEGGHSATFILKPDKDEMEATHEYDHNEHQNMLNHKHEGDHDQ